MKMDGGYVFMLTGPWATIEHTTCNNRGGPRHRGGPGRDGGGGLQIVDRHAGSVSVLITITFRLRLAFV